MSGTKSGEVVDYEPQQVALLKHVALYRLTIEAAVAKVFPAILQNNGPTSGRARDVKVGTALGRLASEKEELLFCHRRRGGKIAAGVKEIALTPAKEMDTGKNRKKSRALPGAGFPGGIPYYTLTTKGAHRAGTNEDRAKKISVEKSLAALWFCCMGARRRYRLEPNEWRALFGTDGPHHNEILCVDESGGDARPCVYSLYVSDQGSVQEAVKHVIGWLQKCEADTALAEWVRSKEYGLVLLVPSVERMGDINTALAKPYRGGPSLADQARILVSVVPTPATLGKFLKEAEKKAAKREAETDEP